MNQLLQSFGHLDRRIIYLLIALSVMIPMAFKLKLPTLPSPMVVAIYDKIEALPPGSRVLLSLDYGPSTIPENQPMSDAVFRHCLAKGHRVVLMTLWATGSPIVERTIERIVAQDFPEKVYGTDYVNLGFKAGNQGVINSLVTNIGTLFTADSRNTPLSQLPIMQGLDQVGKFELLVGVGSGFPGLKEWIQFAGDRTNVPVAGGMTAVEAPLLMPYYPRQLLGIMGGLQGAAEYEASLVGGYPQYRGTSEQAISRMGPQTVAHLVILLLIIVGNVAYFRAKRASGGRS